MTIKNLPTYNKALADLIERKLRSEGVDLSRPIVLAYGAVGVRNYDDESVEQASVGAPFPFTYDPNECASEDYLVDADSHVMIGGDYKRVGVPVVFYAYEDALQHGPDDEDDEDSDEPYYDLCYEEHYYELQDMGYAGELMWLAGRIEASDKSPREFDYNILSYRG